MLKAVVIGAGAMGRRHVKALKSSSEYEFMGISDINQDALKICAKNGIAPEKLFSDTSAMLEKIKPDCVIISTTAPSHAPLALMAMRKGAPLLLIEKPLCVSLRQLEDLRELAEKSGSRVAVNHSARFCGPYQKLKELSGTPGLGEFRSFNLNAGNMGLAMGASHQFELYNFLTGRFPEKVWAWLNPDPNVNPRGAQFKDMGGQIHLRDSQGGRQYLDIGSDKGHGMHISLGFKYGHVNADILGGTAELVMRRTEERDLPLSRYGLPGQRISAELPAFDVVEASRLMLEALAKGENYPGLDRAEDIIRTLIAAYISSEDENRGVDIYSDLQADREFLWA